MQTSLNGGGYIILWDYSSHKFSHKVLATTLEVGGTGNSNLFTMTNTNVLQHLAESVIRLCAKGIMLQTPRTLTKKTLGDRFFSCGTQLWNGLPSQIRNEPNFNRFKGLLKTHLFRSAFY